MVEMLEHIKVRKKIKEMLEETVGLYYFLIYLSAASRALIRADLREQFLIYFLADFRKFSR